MTPRINDKTPNKDTINDICFIVTAIFSLLLCIGGSQSYKIQFPPNGKAKHTQGQFSTKNTYRWCGSIWLWFGRREDDNLSSCTENSDDPQKSPRSRESERFLLTFLYFLNCVTEQKKNICVYIWMLVLGFIIGPNNKRNPFLYMYQQVRSSSFRLRKVTIPTRIGYQPTTRLTIHTIGCYLYHSTLPPPPFTCPLSLPFFIWVIFHFFKCYFNPAESNQMKSNQPVTFLIMSMITLF